MVPIAFAPSHVAANAGTTAAQVAAGRVQESSIKITMRTRTSHSSGSPAPSSACGASPGSASEGNYREGRTPCLMSAKAGCLPVTNVVSWRSQRRAEMAFPSATASAPRQVALHGFKHGIVLSLLKDVNLGASDTRLSLVIRTSSQWTKLTGKRVECTADFLECRSTCGSRRSREPRVLPEQYGWKSC